MHFTPSHPLSLRSVLILSSHRNSDLPSGYMHISLFYPVRVTSSAHLILLELSNLIIFGEKYELLGFLLLSTPQVLISPPKPPFLAKNVETSAATKQRLVKTLCELQLQ
jgi:hypothetical protein